MKTEYVKCGEIFRCGRGTFTFNCSYCAKIFDSKLDVFAHIDDHFQYIDEPKDDKNDDEFYNEKNFLLANTDNKEDKTNLLSYIKTEPKELQGYTELNELVEPVDRTEKYQLNYQTENTLNLNSNIENETQVHCNICGKSLKKKSLIYHMRSHANKREYKCHICDKRFNHQKTLHCHLKYHSKTPPNKVKHPCNICGQILKKTSLIYHMRAHENKREYKCQICDKKFNHQKTLRCHLKNHSTTDEHSGKRPKVQCDICGNQFAQKRNLDFHIRTHTGEKPHKCELCDKWFNQPISLTKHMLTHTGEKPYTCEICNKSFRTKSCYHSHKRLHARIKKFKCSMCSGAFATDYSLMNHMRKHTGERPYNCDVCNKAFTQLYAYRQHMILHTGQKPYKCRFCDAGFAQGAGRRSHERSVHNDSKHITSIALVDNV